MWKSSRIEIGVKMKINTGSESKVINMWSEWQIC